MTIIIFKALLSQKGKKAKRQDLVGFSISFTSCIDQILHLTVKQGY